MKNLRREDLSLQHCIKNNILLDAFVETETDVSLTYLSDVSTSVSYVYEAESNMVPLPTSRGRGWVYVDSYADHVEQSNSVIVKDNLGTVISGTNFMIDYVDGRVIFPNNTFNPVTVTYRWNYVAVVNEWSLIESSDVPVVVVDISEFRKEGFQLGGGKRVPRRVHLHVFASNTAERDDLVEVLYDGIYLKSCANQQFNKGTMIDWDGTFNENYEYSVFNGNCYLKFDNLISRNINPPLLGVPSRDVTMLIDLNRYRARLSFDMFHIEES